MFHVTPFSSMILQLSIILALLNSGIITVEFNPHEVYKMWLEVAHLLPSCLKLAHKYFIVWV